MVETEVRTVEKDISDYVSKYAKRMGISEEEAMEHEMVKKAIKYYEKGENR